MSHRILWPVVACLGLGGLTLVLSQSTAQRVVEPPSGGITVTGSRPAGPPGRFVVANASSLQVLILDTATGQVYRAKEEDFKKMSDLPRLGQPGGRDFGPPVRDGRPEPRDKDDARPARDRRSIDIDAEKDKDRAKNKDRPKKRDSRPKDKDDARPTPKDDAPARRDEKE